MVLAWMLKSWLAENGIYSCVSEDMSLYFESFSCFLRSFVQLGLSSTSNLLVHIFFLAVNLIFWSLCRHAVFCGLCKVSRSDQMIQCHPTFVLVIQIKVLTTYVWKGYCLLSARWDFCFIENEICELQIYGICWTHQSFVDCLNQ